ncbi:MAG: carboxypeptidase-like regulatory domain-containing protein [Pyrinomonadaceae bacterium]
MNLALTLAKWLAPAAALFALACALLAPAEAARARPTRAQDNRAQREETKRDELPDDSVVRGRAVYDDTSRPVRRARVLLITDGGARGEYSGLTDARGDFQISGVRAGSYFAFVDVPGALSPVGFVSLDEMRAANGAPNLGEARKYFDPVEVDGKQDVSVTVRARRGASVSGRVSYADGDPAVNVTINLLRRGADGRVQKYLAGASVAALSGLRTDDRGMFRVMGLPPGEYLIGITESVDHGERDRGVGSHGEDFPNMLRGMFGQQLLMTFYPSATSVKEAGVIKVEVGDERADVDITIPERALRAISGVVRARRGGRPVARARVTIMRRDDPLASNMAAPAAFYDAYDFAQNGTTADEEGRWHLSEIPDGPYTINVRPPEEYEGTPINYNSNLSPPASAGNTNGAGYSPPRRRRPYAPTRRNLDVSGDVTEFVVEVADGGRVAGTISIEGEDAPRYSYVSLQRAGGGGAAPEEAGTHSASAEGGRFTVEGLPAGKFFLLPNVGGSDDSRLYLKSISWNGKDLLREPLELPEGGAAEGVRVVFARNPATLRVTARAADGKRPAADLFVILVPADISGWSSSSPPYFCTTGRDGICPILAPPGEYRVVALRNTPPGAYEQEVRRRATTAPRVTLREGETRQLELEAPDN